MKRLRKWLGRILLMCTVVLLAWLGATAYYESEFDRAVDALRARGVRVELVDFNRPSIPDERNAAVVVREAFAKLETHGFGACKATWVIEDNEPDADIAAAWTEVEAWVDGLAPWYEAVERAARMPECEFGIDWTQGHVDMAEVVSVSAEICETLDWRMRVGERRGRPVSESLRDCETVFRWARSIRADARLLFHLRNVIETEGCRFIQRLTRHADFDVLVDGRRLGRLLIDPGALGRLDSALDLELAFAIHLTRQWASWSGSRQLTSIALMPEDRNPDYGRMVVMLASRPLVWRSSAAQLELRERGRAILRRDDRDSLPELERLFPEDEFVNDWSSAEFPSLNILLPRVYRTHLKHQAHLRVTRLGLAAQAFRAQHGDWPSGPAGGLVDPFTREPFEFVREGDALRIEAAYRPKDEDERIYWVLGER